MNIFDLTGKTAVLIGGAGVLGTGLARGLAKAGARIVIADLRRADEAAAGLKAQGFDAKGMQADALDLKSLSACCDAVVKGYGSVDVLVNLAGGNQKEATTSEDLSFFDLPLTALEKVVNLNLFAGALLPAQAFGRAMAAQKGGGSIINISSMNALRPLTRIPGYSAAKAAVSNFTQWLAVHLAQNHSKELRVNAIAPGFFLTEQNRFLLTDKEGGLTGRGKAIISHTPQGRFGEPQDLEGVCVWLASDASKFVTGTVIPVDGGFGAYSGV